MKAIGEAEGSPVNRISWLSLAAGIGLTFLSIPQTLVVAQEGNERTFGRGGLDLGWGKGEEWDADDDAKEKATPTAIPIPQKGDDSFFKRDVEDTGAGDKM